MKTAPTGTWPLILVTSLGPISWGTTYLVATEWLPPGRPLLDAAVRALPAGLLIVAATRTLPRGSWWWRAALLGTLNIGLFFALLFVAAYRLPGGVAATLGAVQPLLVTGFAALLLGERVRARLLVSGLLGVVGVGLLVLRATATLDTLGVVAGLIGTASMGLGVVLAKKWPRPQGASLLAFSGWMLAGGGLFLLPLAALLEGPPPALSATNLGGFAYLAVVNTGVAYLLWLRGIERLPAPKVAFLSLLSPIVATLLGWLVVNERLSFLQLVGLLLALGSLVAAQLPARSRGSAVPQELVDELVEAHQPGAGGDRLLRPSQRGDQSGPDRVQAPAFGIRQRDGSPLSFPGRDGEQEQRVLATSAGGGNQSQRLDGLDECPAVR